MFTSLIAGCLTSFNALSNDDPYDIDKLSAMTLTEILGLKVVTPSRIDQSVLDSTANITVVTAQTIAQRGYQNLYQVLQDIPGFDFATYEDGGGEYPNHSLNRGIGGTPGNPKLLVMVDGVVQNHIAFNWSQLFGEEQIFADLERIEILQGPVSAVYGANAFSGIVHFITQGRKQQQEFTQQLHIGDHQSRSYQASYANKSGNIYFNFAGKYYRSDGDGGLNRPDPGNYFSNNPFPAISLADYGTNQQYQLNSPHPYAGQQIPDGFNTEQQSWSARGTIEFVHPKKVIKGFEQAKLSIFTWQKEQGLGSYVPGYEYQATLPSFSAKHSAKQANIDYGYRISENLLLSGSFWYRQNRQHPSTGFQYTFRFVDLVKSYHSLSRQHGVEKRLHWSINPQDTLQFGARFISSDKMNQVVSLGQYQNQDSATTTSSWDLATRGENPALGQSEQYPVNQPNEQAFYVNYDSKVNQQWSYTAGLRIDKSDDYDTTTNPRLGIIYQIPNDSFEQWNIKLLYGEAFREPSSFELNDEFRGNSELNPEQIKTVELVSQIGWHGDEQSSLQSLTVQGAIYYSDMNNLITLVPHPSREGGAIYANATQALVAGASLQLDGQINDNWSFYSNYHYGQGKDSEDWQTIEHSARHKFNWGINWQDSTGTFNVNLRHNYVGKRAVPATNGYFTDYAPSYNKTNLTIGFSPIRWSGLRIKPQLMVKNLFDKSYLGVGRQTGSSVAGAYHPMDNPNPAGFIPGYHPQAGRTVGLYLSINFDDI